MLHVTLCFTAQKMNFSDLVTFNEEILQVKLCFLCSALQGLKGHSFSSRIFMAELKTFKNPAGTNFHISGRKEPNDFVP